MRTFTAVKPLDRSRLVTRSDLTAMSYGVNLFQRAQYDISLRNDVTSPMYGHLSC